MVKTNFETSKKSTIRSKSNEPEINKEKLSQSEFEEYILQSGAAGSFMIFRSDKKEDEMGMDEL